MSSGLSMLPGLLELPFGATNIPVIFVEDGCCPDDAGAGVGVGVGVGVGLGVGVAVGVGQALAPVLESE
ncbi:MAG: hypothetical protein IPL01_04055 [Acidobacteria bacterium]|nr:hypothetical protein [Acidobacteriota bacterium]